MDSFIRFWNNMKIFFKDSRNDLKKCIAEFEEIQGSEECSEDNTFNDFLLPQFTKLAIFLCIINLIIIINYYV